MTAGLSHVLLAACLVAGVLAVYGVGLGLMLRNVRPATDLVIARWPAMRQHTAGEVDAVVRLSVGAVVLLAAAAAGLVLTGTAIRELHQGGLRPELLGLGVLLGVGELGLATFVGYVAVNAGLALAPTSGPADVDDWLSLSRGGWMRSFFQVAEAAPVLALVLSLLFVTAEEVLFRGIIVLSLGDAGAGWALGVSVSVFAASQAFQMPSWQSAMFPVLGALTVGLLHGLLLLAVPTIIPLIVAHWVFFAVSIL